MRLVLDTNVLVAAFVSRGHCHELLEYSVRLHEVFASEFILSEYRRTLADKLKVPENAIEDAVELIRSRVRIVEPGPLSGPVSRDSDDDTVLATAVTSKADCLVTGDGDLLSLESYKGVRILAPGAFWQFEAEQPIE